MNFSGSKKTGSSPNERDLLGGKNSLNAYDAYSNNGEAMGDQSSNTEDWESNPSAFFLARNLVAVPSPSSLETTTLSRINLFQYVHRKRKASDQIIQNQQNNQQQQHKKSPPHPPLQISLSVPAMNTSPLTKPSEPSNSNSSDDSPTTNPAVNILTAYDADSTSRQESGELNIISGYEFPNPQKSPYSPNSAKIKQQRHTGIETQDQPRESEADIDAPESSSLPIEHFVQKKSPKRSPRKESNEVYNVEDDDVIQEQDGDYEEEQFIENEEYDENNSSLTGKEIAPDFDQISVSVEKLDHDPAIVIGEEKIAKKTFYPEFHSDESISEEDLLILCDPLVQFFEESKNYDCMPNSGKVLCFDMELFALSALNVVIENEIGYGVLWDGHQNALVGMLTHVDVLDFLLEVNARFEEHPDNPAIATEYLKKTTIRVFREEKKKKSIKTGKCLLSSPKRFVLQPSNPGPETPQTTPTTPAVPTMPVKPVANRKFIFSRPNASLLDTIHMMVRYRIHRVPIIHQGKIIHIISQAHLISYLATQIGAFDHPIFQKRMIDLNIGTFGAENLISTNGKANLIELCNTMQENHLYAIPVLSEEGTVYDVFTRLDIFYLLRRRRRGENLASNNVNKNSEHSTEQNNKKPTVVDERDIYSLENLTVDECLAARPVDAKGAFTCSPKETVWAVIQHVAITRTFHIVYVDEEGKPTGIFSLTDFLSFVWNCAKLKKEKSMASRF